MRHGDSAHTDRTGAKRAGMGEPYQRHLHRPGTRYYGKTASGRYMSEQDALNAGYRKAGNE